MCPDTLARPLAIAYLGNFDPPNSTETYVARALEDLGHRVIRCQENNPARWEAVYDNLRGSDGPRADMVLWTRTGWDWDHILPGGAAQAVIMQHAMLAAAEEAGVPTVGYHLDRWWGLNREPQVHSEPFFRVSLLCTADGGHDAEFAAAGINHRWTPPAVSGSHAAQPGQVLDQWRTPVVFVGRWRGYHREWVWRRQLVRWLQTTYAGRFALHEGALPDSDLSDVYASAGVVVGDSCLLGDATRYWSNRIPETLGRGGFLIHPYVEGMNEHFQPGEHLVTFPMGDWAALGGAIDYYLAHPDEAAAIRAAGRAHVLTHHTFERRLADLIDHLVAEGAVPNPYYPDRVAGYSGPIVKAINGTRVTYELRDGTADGAVVDETWAENAYRAEPEDVAGGLVVDVGAHVGAFTLWAVAAGAALVHAYEPNPENRAQLLANLAANAYLTDPAVLVHDEAVTDRTGRSYISAAELGYEGDATLSADSTGTEVATLSLHDAILRAIATSDHTEVAWLKIDAEWSEYKMAETIGSVLRLVRRASVEFHGPWMHDPDERDLDPLQVARFGQLVAVFAEYGHVEVLGRPSVGGYLHWRRYE